MSELINFSSICALDKFIWYIKMYIYSIYMVYSIVGPRGTGRLGKLVDRLDVD
uniref:Uncharacterized protein n=1 Tax=Arundo donax TaxID=35708 RepID=A0A0A9DHK6_ARUDO